MGDSSAPKRSWPRRILRWAVLFTLAIILAATVGLLILFWPALMNRYYHFPKQAAALEQLRTARQEVTLDDGWTEYRGICHSHSELSHDSEVKFPDILRATKIADVSFMCMTDHPKEGKADFSTGWKGMHDGVLFIRGFEMNYGFMPWGLPDDTVLDANADPDTLAQQIASKGGVLFFAHSEEEREWDLPQVSGMEIYNIHSNVKEKGEVSKYLLKHVPDFILSLNKYPDQIMRQIFDRQTAILAHWDEINKTRKFVGIAAADAHQNNGIRGDYTADGNLRLRETSPDDGNIIKLNFFTRGLLRFFCGPLEPGRELFRIEFDKYERSIRFTNTHILARELTEPAVLDALKSGRVFVGFDMLADARGFTYLAEANGAKAVMGEEISMQSGLTLHAASPEPCRFILMRDGEKVTEHEGRTFDFPVSQPGNYRVEAELSIVGEWTPWVYANPIRITAGTTVAAK